MFLRLNCYVHNTAFLFQRCIHNKVAWPSGLRRWFKAPVSSEAWVRIPPLPECFCHLTAFFGRAVASVIKKNISGDTRI